ncbi:MAG: O-antigen ligase family protein [Chloroflexia bacterium]
MSRPVTAGTTSNSAKPLTGLRFIGERKGLLQSEPVVLAAMLLSLGLYYFVPGLVSAVVGGALFFALTLYRPDLHLVMVPLTVPLFYRPRPLGNLYFSLAEVVIVCGVAAWALRDGTRFMRERKFPSVTAARAWVGQPAVILAVVLGMIGLLWLLVPEAEYRKIAAYDFWRTVLSPLLFFAMMLRWLRTERDIWRMVAAWLVTASLIGREGVEQYLFGETVSMEGVGRASSVYPSSTALGIYLGRAIALSIVLTLFLPSTWRFWRIACAIFSLIIGLGVLFSFARGAWIGVFVALVVVGILTRHRVLSIGIGAATLAALAALPFINVERITSIFDLSGSENTGVARFRIWSAAINILRDHPFTGIGQDQFIRQDPVYEVPSSRFFITSHPHNLIFDFWLRLGLPGLLWMFAVLVYFFWEALRLWRQHVGTALGALLLGLIASMITFVVHGLLDMAYFTMDLAVTFWLTVGLIVLVKRYQSLEVIGN